MVSGLLYLETRAEPRFFFMAARRLYKLIEVEKLLGNHPKVWDFLEIQKAKQQKKLPTNVGKLGEAPTNRLLSSATNNPICDQRGNSSQRVRFQ